MDSEETTHSQGETSSQEPEVRSEDDEGGPDGATAPPKAKPSRPPTVGRLRRDRRRLWNERQETVYHLGGLAADLHARGMIDQDLLVRRAHIVHEIDARIAEIDGELTERDEGRRRHGRLPRPAGYCMSCGAPFLPEAAFCSQCGARIHVAADAREQATSGGSTASDSDADTEVIPAIRDPEGA